MTLLGLDFDNTIVRYDRLFHQLAIEKGLIKESLPANKTAIRNYLRSQGLDEQFTLLQGEVYGLRILEAEAAEGMLETLHTLQRQGIRMVIVSHKTKTPYKGPNYDLHQAAWSWLEKHKFFSEAGLNWSKNQVFFEVKKEAKLARILKLRCTHYVDDLVEILDLIPNDINKILYDPNTMHSGVAYTQMHNWSELGRMLQMTNA